MDTTLTSTSIVEFTTGTEHRTLNIKFSKEMEVHIKSIQRSVNTQNTQNTSCHN